MYNLVDRAIIFAVEAHSGTMRKSSKIPYILHPIEAAAIVSTMTDDMEVIAATILHDVLEDTNTSVEQLEKEFGSHISSLVIAESENKRRDIPSSNTWKIRKQETVDALNSETNIEIKMIALSDKLSNIRGIYNEYLIIGDEVWNRFNQKSKQEHKWYHNNIAKCTSELQKCPAWKEYMKLINVIFGE